MTEGQIWLGWAVIIFRLDCILLVSLDTHCQTIEGPSRSKLVYIEVYGGWNLSQVEARH